MSASPIRRLRLTAPVLAMVVAVSLLVGCAGQQAPGSYTAKVKDAFIEGCWTTLVRDVHGDAARSSDGLFLSADLLKRKFPDEAKKVTSGCTCAYGKIEKGVSFSEFKKINEARTNKPSQLPASFTKAYGSCGVGDATAAAG